METPSSTPSYIVGVFMIASGVLAFVCHGILILETWRITIGQVEKWSGGVQVLMSALSLSLFCFPLPAILAIVGGICTARTRMYWLALLGAFATLLSTGVFVLGAGVGIWALIVLLRKDVKLRFEKTKGVEDKRSR